MCVKLVIKIVGEYKMIDKYLEKYVDYLKYERNYSLYTIDNYKSDILEFINYLNINYLDINYDDVKNYLMYLKDTKNDNNSSIDRKLSSLRSFYKYLVNNDIIDNNVFNMVNGLKKEKKLPRFFEYNELEELFKVPEINTSLGQRDLLILEMLYATGVRVGELVSIKVSDINKSLRVITILGKGNKERFVKYGEYCEDILNKYLDDGYIFLNKNNSDYLFLNKNGDKITERGIRYILDSIVKKTSINKNISPHMIRHSFATHLLNEGCDLISVQKLLGHESIAATQVYTHVSADRLKDVYYHSFPRAKKRD